MKKNLVLKLAISAGEVLLRNGAEIFRVQETIERILTAFGIRDYSLYVVSNGIFVTLGEDGEDCRFALRHVAASTIHLGRIAAVNDLSRSIEQNPDHALVEDYLAKLQGCADLPPFPLWLRMLMCGIGSGGFCYLFEGGLWECAAAFFCGVILQAFMSLYGSNTQRSRFMNTIMGAVLVSTIAFGACVLLPALSLDHIIIGAIISLVPGVALTTSIRDFFNGDHLSGNIHLTDALLTGVCIAVGVGTALQFWQFVMGGFRV